MASPNSTFSVNQVLTAQNMNDLPFGFVTASTATASTAIAASTPLAVLTATFTVVPNRRYLIMGRIAYQTLGGAGGVRALYLSASGLTNTTLQYETTNLAQFLCSTAEGFAYLTAANFGVTSGSGTSKTVTLNFRMNTTGQLNTDPDGLVGANSFPQQLFIFDVGTA